MHFKSLFHVLSIFVTLIAVCLANDKNFEYVKKAAGGSVEVNHAYAFEYGQALTTSGVGHFRLVVAWIRAGDKVETHVYDQEKEEGKSKENIFSIECSAAKEKKDWDFEASSAKLTYLGELKPGTTPSKVKKTADAYTLKYKNYNIVFNNCHQFVQNVASSSGAGSDHSHSQRRSLSQRDLMVMKRALAARMLRRQVQY